MNIRPTIPILLVLALTMAVPYAAAGPEDDEPTPIPPEGGPLEDTCYEVNPYSFPPVYVYECPHDG